MKRTLIFLIAIVMAGITTYLFYNYTQSLKPKAEAATSKMVTVVAAKEEIKKDTVISGQMLTVVQVPENSIQPDVVKSIADVTGKVALVDIEPNETILSHHIQAAKDSKYLAYKIQPGYRAISVTAKIMAESVANLIEPGDYVDVIFSTKGKTTFLLEDVHVLAVDQRMEQSSAKHPYKPYTMTTLEVKPEDALKIVDAEVKTQDKITLVLRSALQSSKEE